MRATLMYGAGDVRVEDVPDPKLREATDAVVRVLRSCICGSDLWPYGSMPASQEGRRMGHEYTCDFCTEGLQTSCRHGGQWDAPGVDAGQGEHGVVTARVGPGKSVTAVDDGAVGLSAVLAAKRLGAERIILMGRHTDRTDLGRDFGATDVVAERGEEGIERVRELTRGDGTHAVVECVGTKQSLQTALGVVRDGGVVSRLGVSQYTEVPMGFDTMMRNITLAGGAAPARAYIEQLLPDILDGVVEPGQPRGTSRDDQTRASVTDPSSTRAANICGSLH